ncbi:restriction endonuclease subunit S [Pseudoclavibacter caeni]|uniref:Type I restriction modification DNA specificity domain-containing protein n=1 Tax=Pseudoclavibacter caeni TaxID=908846 RepID=A0A7C8FUS2_9MICO|nr:restriction endonuclease subunit S [Pseudoclavibacter caeni]KAB1632454.1 hypothetical protein F8O02_05510 [Pseudoclavibacter caeni]NYJ97711.1 type I restriction enzyme S subunit [Pseudoclavibacter caeni]
MKAQDLKNSILQLAVQGKLVPQDPSDEPAGELLERIREERAELIEQKKIRRPKGGESVIYREGNSWFERCGKSEPACIDDEIPFDIPESWEWARLETVTSYIQRGKSPRYSSIEKYPVVAQKCNQWSGFSLKLAKFIDPDTVASYAEERILRDGDLLWNSTGIGTLGRMAVYDSHVNKYGWAVADSHVTVIRTKESWLDFRFAYLYFAGPSVQLRIEDQASGSTKQKELAQETVRNYLIPIPPIEEQRLIVEKVNELMPLVEEYGRLEDAREKLDAELPDRLRKSVLQLAVEGKLVPQDPSDEPAGELLERIRGERGELVKQKKIRNPKGRESVIYREGGSWYERRGKSEPVCIDDEIPFDIPESWEWARLESLCRVIVDCPHSTPQYLANETGYIAIDTNCIDDRWHQTDGRNLSKESYESRVSKYVPQIGDIVFTREGSIGRSVILARENVCLGQRVMLMSTEPYALYNKYCQIVLSSAYAWLIYKKANVGTGVKHINVATVKSLLVPIPPLAEQRRIVEKVDQIMKLIGA